MINVVVSQRMAYFFSLKKVVDFAYEKGAIIFLRKILRKNPLIKNLYFIINDNF